MNADQPGKDPFERQRQLLNYAVRLPFALRHSAIIRAANEALSPRQAPIFARRLRRPGQMIEVDIAAGEDHADAPAGEVLAMAQHGGEHGR